MNQLMDKSLNVMAQAPNNETDEHKQSWFDYLQKKGGHKPMVKNILLAMSVTFITACGGGGDSSAPTEVAVTPTTPATGTTPPATETDPEPEEETTPSPTSIDDLVVAPEFEMQAVFDLAVNVELSSTERGYFSLCDDFTQGAQIEVNYDSCLLRGPLTEGKLDEVLTVANHQHSLMAVIWFYDGSAPQYTQWQYDPSADEQQLTLN
ncbi:hypothetical protein ACFOD0_04520 [Shewanella intestini]|uniref:Lipoprotein n=1 Tax=Shewanella intestini TaxID=2017544 RepID=A0ABS5I0M7_9GAMM|nr:MULTISPECIES: hypothetical protein [Shewanella]MBR9727568.1 hypothetical protein [Shewanella intestini]MRG35282.1 hypothetical protein [Shewanella sp. XMDDZSB0408]